MPRQKMVLSSGYLRKPQDVTALTKDGDAGPQYVKALTKDTALTKDGAVSRIPEKATGRHGSDT
jgi:hypothetical protein